jgi:hypothetical protein
LSLSIKRGEIIAKVPITVAPELRACPSGSDGDEAFAVPV